jgi:ABC-2 type transport system ATP-binding protein
MRTPYENLIEIEGLRKRFGDQWAVDDVDLTVAPGEAVGLLGHNGAGKTTTVRILATLLRPDGGTARVGGHDVVREAARVRELVAFAGQQATLDEKLTGHENLVLLGRLLALSKRDAHRRAGELLERFALSAAAGKLVETYSGGMRRRLDIAACLVVPRPVVFLDEPTTGLDPLGRAEVWSLVRELLDGGTALLLTTQYLEEADRLADRISVLAAGRVVASGTPNELKDLAGGRHVEIVVGDVDRALAALAARGVEASRDGAERHITAKAPDGDADLARVLDALRAGGIPVDEVALRRPTLDDAFFALSEDAA